MQNYVNTQYCNAGSKKKRYGVRLTVKQNSQNITNNTSNITVTFELGGAGALGLSTDYTGSSMSGYTNTGKIYVNGTQKATGSSSSTINNSTKVTLVTWTGNVEHGADGKLSIPIKGVFTGGTSTQASGGEASGTVTFDTIPRASSVACTTANIGANPTITITSAVSSFTHKLYYLFGSISKTLITDSGLTGSTNISYSSWTIPTTFYAQIPNGPSGTGTITCETYSGSTLIGTKTCSFTVNVPASAKPNISNPTIVDTDTVSKNTIQAYVVGKSKLQFTFPTFSTNYSSTLKSYTLKINGTQVYSGTATSYTMSTNISQTSNKYELIITDSRDISNTTGEVSFTAYTYTEPKITLFTAERNSTTPTTVNLKYSASITNINSNNRNAKSFKIEYRQLNASSWTTVTTATDAYTKTNISVNATNINDSSTFEFRLTATDSYGSATSIQQIGTSATLINFSADGTAIAFGKASESSNSFECALNTNFTGTLKQNGADILQPAYNKIGDLSTLTTTTKTSTVAAINEINTNMSTLNFMIAYPSTTQTLSTANTTLKINLNSRGNYSGNKLSFDSSSHGIVIGAGVNYIEVVGQIYVTTVGTVGLKNVYVYKNEEMVGRSLLYLNSSYQMISTVQNIVPVAQGDVITLRANSPQGTTTVINSGQAKGLETFLMVRVIG